MLLMTLALLVLQLPGMGLTKAYAADKSITGLGTGSIQNPSGIGAWNFVYYGKYEQNGSSEKLPVKYRVLDKASADFDISGGSLLLDCDTVLLDMRYDRSTSEWANSNARTNLNGNAFLNLDGVFTDAEKAAIAMSTKPEAANGDGEGRYSYTFAALKGDKIFLLDAKEVTRISYGYGINIGVGSGRTKGGVKSYWWLRSPYNNSSVAYADDEGKFMNADPDFGLVGVSPAFNINLSPILFASEISSEPGSYKLTLKDNSLSIKKDGDITRNGKTITVPYSVSGTHNRVSVLMTDKAYNDNGAAVKYYGELSSSKQFTLPDGYNTNWKVYILAEQVNGEKETDYASEPVEIPVPAASSTESDPQTITDAGEKDEVGSSFYPLCLKQKKVTKNAITFTWKKVKGATGYTVYGCLCGKNKSQKLATVTGTSFTWKKLKKGTYYKVYVVAKDGGKVIATSKKAHVATKGKSYGNVTSVSVKKKTVRLKKGKTFKLGASFKKTGTVKQHRKLSYETTKPKVAKVDKKGKIKAVGVGTCYVYAYTQNGFYKRVKVVVKK